MLGHIPWPGRYWALPFLTVPAPSQRYFRQRGRTPKSSPAGPVRWSCNSGAGRPTVPWRWWETAATPSPCRGTGQALDLLHFCQSLPQPVTFITRLRLDAGLYGPAPARLPGQNGRPRVKGRRLPTLKELVDHSGVPWEQASAAWYDGAARTVETASQTAVWYHTGKPPAPIPWVLIRDPLKSALQPVIGLLGHAFPVDRYWGGPGGPKALEIRWSDVASGSCPGRRGILFRGRTPPRRETAKPARRP